MGMICARLFTQYTLKILGLIPKKEKVTLLGHHKHCL